MATVFITPNMNLPSPVPGQEPGPQWATDNYNCLALIDSHNHSSGQGVPISPSGIDINSDLSFSGNNAINLRSVRFTSQSSALALAADIGCLYEAGVDLYYNDGSGNQIRITQSGSLAGAAGTITGLPSGTASASYSAASGTFVWEQSTSTAANMDVGSLIIRYPGSYPTPSGNYIILSAPTSLSTGYQITLPATTPVSTLPLKMTSTGVIGSGQISTGEIEDAAITAPKIAAGAIDNSKIADGQVTANKLASDAVTTVKILDGAVTSAKIANSTITHDNIAGSTIIGADISANINLPGTTVAEGGRFLVVSSVNEPTSLAICRSTLNSSGGVLTGAGIASVTHTPGTGIYGITLTNAFSTTASPFACPTSGTTATAVAVATGLGTFAVTTYASGVATDAGFNFMVIGTR